jgi:hypothetical protein
MGPARYALYYVPPKDSALAEFGRTWLGVDIETGDSVKHAKFKGITARRLEALTASPRFYGFHGTLKAPFQLASQATLDGMLSAARLTAQRLKPVTIPPFEIAIIGKFLALTPIKSSPALEVMASGFVRSLDAFRQRKTAKELAQYRQSKLTVHQEQMLEHWGYPYVLEEFRFHLTVTDRIDDPIEREETRALLEDVCADFLGKKTKISSVAICTQPAVDTYMRVVEHIHLRSDA